MSTAHRCSLITSRTCLALALVLILLAQSARPIQAETPASGTENLFLKYGALTGVVTDLSKLDEFEKSAAKRFTLIKIYQIIGHGVFWTDFAQTIDQHGAVEFLSLDPTLLDDGSQSPLSLCEVLSKEHDAQISAFAAQIKAWGKPILVSTAGEMNGNWARWSGDLNFGESCDQTSTTTDNLYGEFVGGCSDAIPACADGPERYRAMYRHIHDLFAAQGANNVRWVWVVNEKSFPDDTANSWNAPGNYYPGDDYVDVISIDGFNWGASHASGWRPFGEIFTPMLTKFSGLYSKPIIIGEFGSVEGAPGAKAAWIEDAYQTIQVSWPGIKAAVYFDSDVKNENSQVMYDFHVNTSPESRSAFIDAINPCYWAWSLDRCRVYAPFISR